jgi:hypothetical protein
MSAPSCTGRISCCEATLALNSPPCRRLIPLRRTPSLSGDRERTLAKLGLSAGGGRRSVGLSRVLAVIAYATGVLIAAVASGIAQDSSDVLVDHRDIGPYHIEIRTVPSRISGFFGDFESTLTIRRDGRTVFRRLGQEVDKNGVARWPVSYDFAGRQNGVGTQDYDHFSASDQSPLADPTKTLVIRKETTFEFPNSALVFLLQPRFKFVGEIKNAFWWYHPSEVEAPIKADLLVLGSGRLASSDPEHSLLRGQSKVPKRRVPR